VKLATLHWSWWDKSDVNSIIHRNTDKMHFICTTLADRQSKSKNCKSRSKKPRF